MSIDITIKDNSKEILKELERRVHIALEECGLAAERFAKEEITKSVYDTPESPNYRRTGYLRNSITHALSGEDAAISEYTDDAKEQHGSYSGSAPAAKENEMSVYVGTNVEYAPYVEMGTVNMGARPFIKPAVTDHQKEYKEILERWLGK